MQLPHASPAHWSITLDTGRVAWATFDKAGASSNTLSRSVLEELARVLDALQRVDRLAGVVFLSGKSAGFILGADVTEFGQISSGEQAERVAGFGQSLMDRIAGLGCPTVAAINGFALGGGLELALACTYRIAAHSYERTMGLPEVNLGIHPGFGGSVRIVQLLGPLRGLDMMLTGRSLSPIEAVRAGLVDRTVDSASLRLAAVQILQERPPRRKAPWYQRLLNQRPIRDILARKMRATVAKKAKPQHYPAPFAIVDLWQKYGSEGRVAYIAEIRSIARLLVTPTCRNLVRVFHLRERLRNLAPPGEAVKQVHVVGAGVMGGDIAAWCALRGMTVSLQDRELQFVEPALARAQKLFSKRLKAPGAAAAAAARILPDIEGRHAPDAQVVIEAIVEKAEVKQQVFASLESRVPEATVLSTNTSSIRIEDIAAPLQNSGRLVGIHFFNPVAKLPLVEVVAGDDTNQEVVHKAIEFVTQIGKLPLPCSSAPGFVVNRVLMPYMMEALRAHEEGVPIEAVDLAATRFGMPTGPIELADRVGLDVALHVAEILGTAFGGEAPAALRTKVDAGKLGVKTEAGGFYRYEKGRPVKSKLDRPPDADLEDRLILPLVNECVACLTDGVVAEPDLIDAGVIFGTGFAPFTGGPINYARERGVADVVARLEALASQFGDRFAPNPGWEKIRSYP